MVAKAKTPVQIAVKPAAKPAAPARRVWVPPPKTEHPKRLRRSAKSKKIGAIFVGGKQWGCPFRIRETLGQWLVVWTGDELGIDDLRPRDWENIPCSDRSLAAQVALYAFEDWLISPNMKGVLAHARESLRGFNLVCTCPIGYPCHGDALLRLVNEREDREAQE
jgi:hypothetical protein